MRLGRLPGTCPCGDGLCGFARFGPMAGEYFGTGLLQDRKFLIDSMCHLPMKFFAPALEQRLIGGIPDQCMLELIGRLWSNASHVKQIRVCQDAQRFLEIVFCYRMDRTDQFVGEFASNNRADLGDLLGRAQPI